MSTTVAISQGYLNTHIGDSSTDRISAAERLAALSEATVWVQEELGNDLQNFTQDINYYDTVHYYKVTTDIADLLEGADLRRDESDQNLSFAHKSARELAEEIGQGVYGDPSWAIERRDDNTYLVINHSSKYKAKQVATFDSTTADGGTWTLDAVNSDATNLTVDTVESKQGAASLNFDMDIDQSGNSRLTIYNSTYTSSDWSDYEDLAAHIIWVYIPDTTNFDTFDSITVYWGSSDSAYWSVSTTTQIDGTAFTSGWNRIKVNWADATKTGSPDETAIDYLRVDFNYTTPAGDDTDFRIDDWIMVRPEILTFHYISWKVGVSNAGADLYKFAATTDIPYYSGQYDNLDYVVAHKAASIIFRDLRLLNESQYEELEAQKALSRIRKLIPSSRTQESKSFKVFGVNFRRRK